MAIYLSDYYAKVADILPTIGTLDPSVVYRAINRARRRMAKETDAALVIYPFNLQTGIPSYALPTISGNPLMYVMEVACYIGNLRYILTRIAAGQIPMSNFQGWPVWYYLLQQMLYYYPTPPSPYASEIKGRVQPQDLDISNTIAESAISSPYQDAVASLACHYLAVTDGNAAMIKGYWELYVNELRGIPKLEI